MGKIALLDQNTINQIAAGEVIERPAAVVKELVENAIDAGANAITVEIKEGGISFIRITDNGTGIDEEDIPLVFLRHSTSKIRTATDLLTVSSLGFRGEALSSVAAIAQVELVTKTSDSFTGIRYVIAGGDEKSMEHIGCPNGTTFIIRNLFFNTPARRKFLKSPVTEAGYINDIMERLVVSHPNISFKFINNNQVKLHSSGNNNLKDILYNVYGREITNHLVYIEDSIENIKIHGFIAKPIVTRGNRNYENYFINSRYIKSGLIYKAIEEAYKPYIMAHRYPFTSLHIEILNEMIDVNVHPAKLEIRFKNGEELYQFIYQKVKGALEGKELIPKVKLTEEKEEKNVEQKLPEPFEVNRLKNTTAVERRESSSTNVELYDNKSDTIESKDITSLLSSHQANTFNQSIGLYDNNRSKSDADKQDSYLPIKDENHSLEQNKEEHNSKLALAPLKESYDYSSVSKNLDKDILEKVKNTEIGIAQEVTEKGKDFVREDSDYKLPLYNDKAEQLTFISQEAVKSHRIIGQVFSTYWIVEFGNDMYLIDQHAAHEKVMYENIMASLKDKIITSQLLEPPIIISCSMREEETLKKNMSSLNELGFEIEEFGGKEYAIRSVPSDFYGLNVRELFIELLDGLVDENFQKTPDMVLEKIASMSCKAAVKGNTRLSFEEAKNLIDELLTLENPYHCPHGRPTIISMSKYELEKKFKRIV